MKKRTAAHTIQSLAIAIVVAAVPANFISGFVDDKDDRTAVLGLVWLMVGTPAFLILREREE